MPDNTASIEITHLTKGIENSSVGQSLDPEKSKAAAQEGQKGDKEKKNVFKKIGGILSGVLGIQVTFAAMLRQSQIATGFLGAMFQVLGALLDSFLLAFAPMLFKMVQDLARLLPAARELGQTIANEFIGVWDIVSILGERVMPVLEGIWEWIQRAYRFVSELNPLIKRLLVYAVILPRLLNFFGGGMFYKGLGSVIGKVVLWAILKSKAKEAVSGLAKGAGQMLMAIPHARIIAIALAVTAVVGAAIWAIFKPKEDKNESGAIDISGQLGKQYLPSQASQLGGSLNDAYSAIIRPFTEVVEPEVINAAVSIGDASTVAAETITKKYDDIGIRIDEYNMTLHDQDVALQNDTKMRQEAVDAATNWTNEVVAGGKKLKTVHSDYGLLITEIDNMPKTLALAAEKYDKKVVAAGAKLVAGASQSKNQFVDTSGIMYTTAVDMSEKTKQFLDTAHAKWEEEALLRGNKGGGAGFVDTWSLTKDIKDLADAATKQKAAANEWEQMTKRQARQQEEDRVAERARQEEIRNSMNPEGLGKFFDYLANY
jgi:hypothetical protein